MSKTNGSRNLALLLAGCAFLLAAGAESALAQGPTGGAPPGARPPGIPGAPPGGFRLPTLPKQGFDINGQDPADYNPEEKAAAAIVEKWIETINNHDTDENMALIDANVLVRPDTLASLMRGPGRYCATMVGIGPIRAGTFILNELYVVGGKSETEVLLKRTDINAPAGRGGSLGGYPVPVATFLRIRNGKIIEWEDMPTTDVLAERQAGAGFRRALDGPPTPARCQKYPLPARQVAAIPAHALNYWYGTEKPEYYWNTAEESAAQAVRAWFAAWQSGDPLLLGAFVDREVIFRDNPSAQLGHGRDNLLRQVCASMGGKRKLIDLFVVGDDYDSAVLTRWDEADAHGDARHMSSMFRVQNGLITEWMYDTSLDGPAPHGTDGAARNSSACQAVDAALRPPVSR